MAHASDVGSSFCAAKAATKLLRLVAGLAAACALAHTAALAQAPATPQAPATQAPATQAPATQAPATPQAPDASAWVEGPKSRARLLAGGPEPDGSILAGVEIALSGKALTYWRNPGDAGVAPAFDAAASRNLAALETIFPAPERHDEGGVEAFGWREGVIFPLRLRPARAGEPILFDLDFRYAACEDICVPAQARLRLELGGAIGAARQSAHRPRIEDWRARAPRPGPADALEVAPMPLAGAKGFAAWRVTLRTPLAPQADLFAEAPEGYWLETRRRGEGFDLTLAERPAGAAPPLEARLTLADGARALEWLIRLDASPSTP